MDAICDDLEAEHARARRRGVDRCAGGMGQSHARCGLDGPRPDQPPLVLRPAGADGADRPRGVRRRRRRRCCAAAGTDASIAPGRAMSPGRAAGAVARRPPAPDRARPHGRPEGTGPVVRPGDGRPLVHHRTADGDVGARPGRRRRAGASRARRPTASVTSPTSACAPGRSATPTAAWRCPTRDVHVALDAPDGTTWTWNDPSAADRVTGPALDFCLARHAAAPLATTPRSTVDGDAAQRVDVDRAGVRRAAGPGSSCGSVRVE